MLPIRLVVWLNCFGSFLQLNSYCTSLLAMKRKHEKDSEHHTTGPILRRSKNTLLPTNMQIYGIWNATYHLSCCDLPVSKSDVPFVRLRLFILFIQDMFPCHLPECLPDNLHQFAQDCVTRLIECNKTEAPLVSFMPCLHTYRLQMQEVAAKVAQLLALRRFSFRFFPVSD